MEPTEEQRKKAFEDAGLTPEQQENVSAGVLDSSMLSPTKTPQFETPTEPTVPSASNIPNEPSPAPLQPTSQENDISALIRDINAGSEEAAGKEAYRAELEVADKNLQENLKAEEDLSGQLKMLQAEAKNIEDRIQRESVGRGRTTAGLAPITIDELRKNSIASNIVGATLAATQGKIAFSQKLVDKAVEAKYGKLEAIQKAKIQNLELLLKDPTLTVAQEERARKQLEIQKKEEEKTAKKKKDTETIISWAAAAAANGASPSESQKIADLAKDDVPDLTKAFSFYAPFAKNAEDIAKAAAELEQTKVQTAKTKAEINKINREAQEMGIPAVTNPSAGQYSEALKIILGSGKFTKDQKAAVVNAINTGDDPFTVVKNQAKALLGQAGETKVTSYEVAREQLDAVSAALKKYYALGGKTSLFSGSFEKVINRLGEITDPNLVEIGVEIQSALQIYRNAVSGTAYSVQEGKDIASIFPGINKSQGLNEAILAGRRKAFQSTIDGTYRSALGNIYDELKQKDEVSKKEKDPLGVGVTSVSNNNPLGI